MAWATALTCTWRRRSPTRFARAGHLRSGVLLGSRGGPRNRGAVGARRSRRLLNLLTLSARPTIGSPNPQLRVGAARVPLRRRQPVCAANPRRRVLKPVAEEAG